MKTAVISTQSNLINLIQSLLICRKVAVHGASTIQERSKESEKPIPYLWRKVIFPQLLPHKRLFKFLLDTPGPVGWFKSIFISNYTSLRALVCVEARNHVMITVWVYDVGLCACATCSSRCSSSCCHLQNNKRSRKHWASLCCQRPRDWQIRCVFLLNKFKLAESISQGMLPGNGIISINFLAQMSHRIIRNLQKTPLPLITKENSHSVSHVFKCRFSRLFHFQDVAKHNNAWLANINPELFRKACMCLRVALTQGRWK